MTYVLKEKMNFSFKYMFTAIMGAGVYIWRGGSIQYFILFGGGGVRVNGSVGVVMGSRAERSIRNTSILL